MEWLKYVVAAYAATIVVDTNDIVPSIFSNTLSSNSRNDISTNHGKKVIGEGLRDNPPQNQQQEMI